MTGLADEFSLPIFPAGVACKGPFISDQALRWLDAPQEKRFDCLHPTRFRAVRQAREQEKELDPEHQLPTGCSWVDVSGRDERIEFLADASRRRMCVLIEAGIGKSTAMQQIHYLRSSELLPGHFAIGFPFSALPDSASEYLDVGLKSFLAQQFCDTPETRSADIPPLIETFRR